MSLTQLQLHQITSHHTTPHRFNRLIEVVRSSLKAMDLSLKGLQVMSSDLEKAHRSISLNQVRMMMKG